MYTLHSEFSAEILYKLLTTIISNENKKNKYKRLYFCEEGLRNAMESRKVRF